MTGTPLLDRLLLGAFRARTRGFLRMEDASGAVPPPPAGGAGYLYLHIPFCEVLCPFCSFHRVLHRPDVARAYFASLRDEIRLYHAAGHRFGGAYFGGGTPTTEPEELVQTIGLVRDLFGVREISVETNPKDLRPEVLEALAAAGVTRLSIGVQSFDDGLLAEMERYEKYGSGAEAVAHIGAAAKLFPTVNVDLIFNLPHQSREMLARDLDIFLSTGANQVSLYPLMSAPTVARQMAKEMGIPDRRHLRPFYDLILDRLRPEFAPSSSWCFTRSGHGLDEYIVEADHYVGVGSGAFSYLDGTLYATSFSIRHYRERVAEGLTGITASHRLSRGDQLRYSLLMRMFGGRLDRKWALERYGRSFFRRVWGELRTLELFGAAKPDADGWSLTDRGRYWLLLMMSAFFESVNGYRDAMRAHVSEELHLQPSEALISIGTPAAPANSARP